MATRDTYTKVHEDWIDKPDRVTPILAGDLEHIESGIKDATDNRALKDVYDDDHINLQTSEHSSIKSTGDGSIVHGSGSCAPNPYSYSGGLNLTNNGYYSHAEGCGNNINGGYAVHTEGNCNTSNGSSQAHLEGNDNIANGSENAHLEGDGNTINGSANAHGEGANNTLNGNNPSAHIEGESNNVYPAGNGSRGVHVEGGYNEARGSYTHVEGHYNKEYIAGTSYNQANHLEGSNNELYTETGYGSHLEGHGNHAGTSEKNAGSFIHIEGCENVGYGQGSHIEGYSNEEGTPSGINQYNHVEGGDNTLSGNNRYVHVSGLYNKATGSMAGAVYGLCNILSGDIQFICGRYNEADAGKAFIVGAGSSVSERKNILTLDWNGNLVLAGGAQLKGNAQIEGDVQITFNNRTVSLFGLQMEVEGRAKGLQSQIDTLRGQTVPAKVFETKAELDEWLAVEGNPETLMAGQNIYIVEAGTPDYWWGGEGLQVLETDKVTIETLTYEETMAILDSENDNGEVA